jgi:predicted ATPase
MSRCTIFSLDDKLGYHSLDGKVSLEVKDKLMVGAARKRRVSGGFVRFIAIGVAMSTKKRIKLLIVNTYGPSE